MRLLFAKKIKPISFLDSLDNGLDKALNFSLEKFEKSNHAYLINLIVENHVILQILHGGMMEQTVAAGNPFNHSFNLTFDEENEMEEKFLALEISKEFQAYEWNEINSYAFNAGNDQTKTKELALEILDKVYGFKMDTMFEIEIFDQGKFPSEMM